MRRALLVGIDDYGEINRLSGCVNDVVRLNGLLKRHYDHSKNFECDMITAPYSKENDSSAVVTRAVFREKITQLFNNEADVALLYFSGHGVISDLGGYLVTQDFCNYDLGISMSEVLYLANQSKANNVFVILDCCHSGDFGTLPVLSNNRIVLSDGVSILTATRSEQKALEVGGGGVFSSLFLEALEGGAANIQGEISAASVYSYIDNAFGAWDQRPLFKTNVSKFCVLRNAKPRLDLQDIHLIITIFKLPAEDLELSSEYEPELEPRNKEKEEIFAVLQKYRNVGLIDVVEASSLYHAALLNKGCRLTNLGKYYWRLVSEDKI